MNQTGGLNDPHLSKACGVITSNNYSPYNCVHSFLLKHEKEC